MSVERSFGIIPTHIIVGGETEAHIYATSDLIENYRNNGYSPSDVAEQAYLLAEERKEANDPRAWDSNQNWVDAERIVAIKHELSDNKETVPSTVDAA